MKKKCLIIEPHSDDSLIAAGGFLLKYSSEYEYYFCLISASDLKLRHRFVSRQERINEYINFVNRIGGNIIENHWGGG